MLWLCDKDLYVLLDKAAAPLVYIFKEGEFALRWRVKGYACQGGTRHCQETFHSLLLGIEGRQL